MKKVISFIAGYLFAIGVANADYRAVFMSQGKPLSQTKVSKIQDIQLDGTSISQNAEDEKKVLKMTSVDSLVFVNDTIVVEFKNGETSVTSDLLNYGFISQVNGDNVVLQQDTTVYDFKDVVIDVKGETSNGSLVINQGKRIKIRLNGVSISNNEGPAIMVEGGKSVTVEIVDGTTNTLKDAPNDLCNAAFYSKGQLIFEGTTGVLNVNGTWNHGISSKDYVQIDGGNLVVSSKSDAIHANDYFVMNGGKLSVENNSGDAIDSGDSIIVRGGELIANVSSNDTKGLKCDGDITIDSNANVTINVTGNGAKGIKSGTSETNIVGNVYIKGGTLSINVVGAEKYSDGIEESSPAAIKSDGNVDITGGVVTIKADAESKSVKGINSDKTVWIHGNSMVDISIQSEKGKIWCVKATQIFVKNGCSIVGINPDNTKVDSEESGTYSPVPSPISE